MVSLAEPNASAVMSPDPIEGVIARLDDPNVVAALHQLIDHVDLLAVLVGGLDELLRRGDTITESIGGALAELRGVDKLPVDVSQLLTLGQQVAEATPALLEFLPVVERIANSDLGDPRLIDLAATVARSAVAGAVEAQAKAPTVTGIRSMLKLLKDEDVGRALGFVFTIAKSLGQELRRGDAHPTTAAG